MVKCKVCEKQINEAEFNMFSGCCPECFDRDCPTCLIFKQQRDKAVKLLENLQQNCDTSMFIDSLGEVTNFNYCHFCKRDGEEGKSMWDINHKDDCAWLLAKQFLDEQKRTEATDAKKD